MIQQILTSDARRISSGPLRIDADWPGYFMRGDEARALAGNLRGIADTIENIPAARFLRRVADDFEKCIVEAKGLIGTT